MASCVILDRAVSHIHDRQKTVQRRIVHSMDELQDGSCNKFGYVGSSFFFHLNKLPLRAAAE